MSVSDAEEARAALEGGAHIIDAKDPTRGSLGAVAPETLDAIVRAVDGRAPVSAALGDAQSSGAIGAAARHAAESGTAFVKIGFRGIEHDAGAIAIAAAAVRGAAPLGTRVVLVAYADARRARSLEPRRVVEIAAQARAHGVILDTAFKDRGSLFTLLPAHEVRALVALAHERGLLASLAGSIGVEGVALARALGADIAGVRGAACAGGRTGRVTAERVAPLAAAAASEVADAAVAAGAGAAAGTMAGADPWGPPPDIEDGAPYLPAPHRFGAARITPPRGMLRRPS
ncbi:MAG TPA: (5-formylfuran-3-yl)methyl phosphate synthase [Gemmatimonadaceae bacterium]|nr:(5-formylfuran-3-yl)methyl phosphate synthase [Gemmatimonadaceae bacterium]